MSAQESDAPERYDAMHASREAAREARGERNELELEINAARAGLAVTGEADHATARAWRS